MRNFPPETKEAAIGEERDPSLIYLHIPNLMKWGNPNASPYSLKLETWLRLNHIDYVVVRDFDLKSAPKGKIPWIEYEGKKIGDSELIINYLSEKLNIKEFASVDGDTSTFNLNEKIAVSHFITTLVSEHTAGILGYQRNYEYFEETLKAYTGMDKLPFYLKFLASRIKKGTFNKLKLRGLAIHSRDEIYFNIGKKDLQMLSLFLGNKKFFFGDSVSRVDASVFSILASLAWIPLVNSPIKLMILNDPEFLNLKNYLIRVKDLVWKDSKIPWYIGEDCVVRSNTIPFKE
ncbi:hypothetical protein HDU92_000029 [Lobulomyces angularis]|nr:hypothetical protein HDU92_000029 [Lobulomyces angularis]